jgi:hypothetical protein
MNTSDFDSVAALEQSTPSGLLGLLSLHEESPSSWSEADAAAILKHQLDARIEFDLKSALPKELAARRTVSRALHGAEKHQVATFRELFSSTRPPLEVLRLAKDFFKGLVQTTGKGSVEGNVARVCYYLSIASARTRLGEQISNLSASELRKGLQWCLKLSWVDRQTSKLIEECLSALP